MKSKQSGDYYYVAMGGPANCRAEVQGKMARPLPKRGSIKRKIFASMAALILDALKRMGTGGPQKDGDNFAQSHSYMMASSCKICCPVKSTSLLEFVLGSETMK